MFGKILRAGKGGHGLKYKIDLQVINLENLPTSIKKCRVVWARSAKLQMTDVKDVRGSVASFKQILTQVTTVYRDKTGKNEPKEYEFKVQVPGKSISDTSVTVGKSIVDMAKYCKDENTTQQAMIPITFKIGSSTTAYLRLSITTIFLGDSNEDGNTEVSGLTGLTSDHGSVREQDLEGFGDDYAKLRKKAKASNRDDGASAAALPANRNSNNKQEPGRSHKPLPSTAEEGASDMEDGPESALPRAKSAKRRSQSTRYPDAKEDERQSADPFAKMAKPTARRVAPKVWEDDEDVSPINSDMSDTEPPKPKAKTSKAKEPDESLDTMKASLFSEKKGLSAAGRGSASSASRSSAAPSSKLTGSKPSRAQASQLKEQDDEDSLRNDLFTAKPKSSAAAAGSKLKAAAESAAATNAAVKQQKPSPVSQPQPESTDDESDDDSGPSTSAARRPAVLAKPRTHVADPPEAPSARAGSSGLAQPESAKLDAIKDGTAAKLDLLQQRIVQLERQLSDEQSTKDEMGKKLRKYVDKIADLEDQLAEGDVTELYTQMREMEARNQAEIKEMEAKYQAEMKDLMERHLAEVSELEDHHQAELEKLEEATSSSSRGQGGASVEELERLRAQVAEQEALLKSRTAKLETEQTAAYVARQAAEAKLAEANKMIDDSLLMATKHQQENRVLLEEITGLKRQLEDASMWETSTAVAAVTAASNNERRNAEVEAELGVLRERVEQLEEENARLQKLVSARGRRPPAAVDNEDKKRIEELQAANHKLEAVCHDLEDKAQFAEEKVETLYEKLEEAKEKIRILEANAAALQKRMEEEMAGGGGRQSKEKVADLEGRVSRLGREKTALEEQLKDERTARRELEEALKDKAGDDEAAGTVAAFEVKYNRLKERYKMLEESSQEELDELQDQLTEAQSQVADLQRQIKQLQAQLAPSRSGGAAGTTRMSSANMEELRNLRVENDGLVQQLVSKTMELAELSESEITIKRELARLQEVNRKLAQKATTLEAQAMVAVAGKAVKGKK